MLHHWMNALRIPWRVSTYMDNTTIHSQEKSLIAAISGTIQQNTVQYNCVQYKSAQYRELFTVHAQEKSSIAADSCTIQQNTVQYNCVQYNSVQYRDTWYRYRDYTGFKTYTGLEGENLSKEFKLYLIPDRRFENSDSNFLSEKVKLYNRLERKYSYDPERDYTHLLDIMNLSPDRDYWTALGKLSIAISLHHMIEGEGGIEEASEDLYYEVNYEHSSISGEGELEAEGVERDYSAVNFEFSPISGEGAEAEGVEKDYSVVNFEFSPISEEGGTGAEGGEKEYCAVNREHLLIS